MTKRLAGHVDNSSYPQISVTIDMSLTTPANAAGPVPVIMELAFAPDFERAVTRPLPEGPGQYGVPLKAVLDKGWGFAVLSPTSYQADDGAGLTEGIIGLMNKGQPRNLSDWGALRAWAWGASRALDYLETDKAVDAKQVGLEGHSRFGKTVLVAMAYDPRFAIAYSSSSGEGGAKLYRHIFGEQMPDLAGPALVSLVRRKLSALWGAADAGRSAGGQPRTDCTLRAEAAVHRRREQQRRWICRAGRRCLGRSERDVSGRSGGGAGLQAAGEKGPGDDGVSADGDGAHDGRTGFPAASRRTYTRAELAGVSGLCQLGICTRHRARRRKPVGRWRHFNRYRPGTCTARCSRRLVRPGPCSI